MEACQPSNLELAHVRELIRISARIISSLFFSRSKPTPPPFSLHQLPFLLYVLTERFEQSNKSGEFIMYLKFAEFAAWDGHW